MSLDSLKINFESLKVLQEQLAQKTAVTSPTLAEWPHSLQNQGINAPGLTKKGFLSPEVATLDQKLPEGYPNYTDWRGFTLKEQPYSLKTEQRVKRSIDMPKNAQQRVEEPYSMRDVPLVFGDWRYDYFKHGLQTIYNKTPIENPPDGQSTLRFEQFDNTPFEQNDPVMFGFDIVFDTISSPLLNGSLLDFIANYNGVDEIWSRRQVYEEFKYQFQKFFRTTVPLKINDKFIGITKNSAGNPAETEGRSGLFESGKKNYLGYYIKKISGLDFLIEQNKGDQVKYVPDYKKDMITIDTIEDVSLSMGTLAHLYKNLYWSRPNGKILFPENLLRFNCFIIISECRNFNRVKKSAKTGNLNIVKDNVNRWVYSLKECQFYFDKMPLPNEIDIGGQGPQIYETFSFNFDFKYSTVKFERFVPSGDWGRYVGYDAGAMWKLGNKTEQSNRGGSASIGYSIPKFFTVGPKDLSFGGTSEKPWYPNLQENGVDKPFVFQTISKKQIPEDDDFNLGSDIKVVNKDGTTSDPSNPLVTQTTDNQNQQQNNNSNVGAQASNLISNSNSEKNISQSDSLKNFAKSSEINSKKISDNIKSSELNQSKSLLKSLSPVNIKNFSGLSKLETNDTLTQGISNLKKLNNSINQKLPTKSGFGDFLNSATSFVSGASNTLKAGQNLSNIVNQTSTNFFNTMGQKIQNGSDNFKEKSKEVFTNISGAATSLKDINSQNLRENLLNKTLDKAYGSKKTIEKIDLQSQLKDFLGSSLGGQL
ncbi:MAG: hypothetical protein EBS06_08895 [Proteobacteria bacterium]|nr:hypothetical protein [Pseudomonadota bacterium]